TSSASMWTGTRVPRNTGFPLMILPFNRSLVGARVERAAGRGFARVEFTAFGVPPEESASRFRETVEIVLRAWTDERLSFSGQHFHFDDVEVLPKPAQLPHPPVWMAASSESAIEWSAG